MQVQEIPHQYLDRSPSAVHGMLLMIALAAVLTVYLLPSIIGRRKRNARDIIRLNVLLGWTIIGWLLAMNRANKTDKR